MAVSWYLVQIAHYAVFHFANILATCSMFWYLGLKCSIFELRCSSQWISKFENEKCLCRVPGLMFESTVPHFVLLMDIEIKLHLCGTAHIVSCAGVAPEGSTFPFPCSGSAGSFSRIRYWPVSGSPDAGKRQERDGRWGVLSYRLKRETHVFLLSICHFCFILCKDNSKYSVTCQKQFF